MSQSTTPWMKIVDVGEGLLYCFLCSLPFDEGQAVEIVVGERSYDGDFRLQTSFHLAHKACPEADTQEGI
ncbi:hypothetical protein LCGC14_1346280 [marine sediment metagenome]|uniref:Uncharacterized protein n=1 Tax=marine sediment metagenome TaxID=412755 RepID=A0A0F9NEM1_9ZZZZ